VDALTKLPTDRNQGFVPIMQSVMVEGTFTPSPSAASFSKAPHSRRAYGLGAVSDTTGSRHSRRGSNPARTDRNSIHAGGRSSGHREHFGQPFPAPPETSAFLKLPADDRRRRNPRHQKFLSNSSAAAKLSARRGRVSFGTLALTSQSLKFTKPTGEPLRAYQIIPVAATCRATRRRKRPIPIT